jgi:lysophospholipase L1-like esterase
VANRLKSILGIVVLIGASIALALGAAEACLRLFPELLPEEAQLRLHWRSINEPASRGHPYLGHMFPPNYEGRFERDGGNFSFTYTTDEHGFRNRAPWPPRAEIVVVGDSMAFGYGVEDDETWTALLEDRLPRARIVNLGLVGAAPQQYLRLYDAFGQELQPALVLFCLFPGNDLAEAELFDRWVQDGSKGNYYLRRFSENGGEERLDLRGLLEQSYLVNFLRDVRQHARSQLGGRTITFADRGRLQLVPALYDNLDRRTDPDHPAFRMTLDAVEQTRALAEQNGSAFLVLLVPTKEEVYLPLLDQEPPPLTAPFAAQFDDLGIPYLDLTPGLRASARQGERLFFEVDGHPNAAGYRLMADLVLDHLRNNADRYDLAHDVFARRAPAID